MRKNLSVYLILFMFAGFFMSCKDESQKTNDFWKQKNNFSGPNRTDAVSFVLHNKAYIATGWNIDYFNDLWQYQLQADTFIQKADLPGVARHKATAFVINEKAYIGLGSYFDVKTGKTTFLNDIWEYDPTTNSWTQKASFPGTPRDGAVAFCIEDTAYVGTGRSADKFLNDFWKFVPQAGAMKGNWTKITELPGQARCNSVAFSINQKGYIAFGRYDSYQTLADMWVYNPINEQWTNGKSLINGKRENAVAIVIDQKAYIGTGWNKGKVLNDWWQFDPQKNTWIEKSYLKGDARMNAIAFGLNNKAYIGISLYENDLWEYHP